MKQGILLLFMLALLSAAAANPIESVVLSRFWFDAGGQLQLQFSEHLWGEPTTATLYDGTNYYTLTVDLSAAQPIIMAAPVFMNPLQGYFEISLNYISDVVHWGAGLENDLSPLIGEQCAVHTLISEFDNSYWVWAKDLSPSSGFGHDPLARSTVDLACYDFSGSPEPNIPVYYQSTWHPFCNTLENGHAELSLLCSKTRIAVKHPQTQELVCDTTFFAEPGQTYPIDVHFYHVAGEDPLALVQPGNFSIYPTVLHGTTAQSLHLDYDAKLLSHSVVELYDLKGRLLERQEYTEGGMDWLLPNKLGSGVYFLRLSSKGQNLGSQKLIILK